MKYSLDVLHGKQCEVLFYGAMGTLYDYDKLLKKQTALADCLFTPSKKTKSH